MSDLGVREMCRLLDGLKDAVRDGAAREEKLNADFRAGTAAEIKRADEGTAGLTQKLADDIEMENGAFADEKNRRQSGYESRKARITRAHAAIQKKLFDEIGEQHGHRKHKIQANVLEAERRRDDALAGTVATLENFRQKTAEAAGALDDFEKLARRVAGGNGKFRRGLKKISRNRSRRRTKTFCSGNFSAC